MPHPTNPSPKPGYVALRRNRWSAPDAEYFVTVKAERPTQMLAERGIQSAIDQQRERLESEGTWKVRCAVTMPDHYHVLFSLGVDTSLQECLRYFKGRLSPILRTHGTRWQAGYYDHRMKSDDDRLSVFLYIFLNPYRANLVTTREKWSGYWCSPGDWEWFGALTDSEVPPPEWLT